MNIASSIPELLCTHSINSKVPNKRTPNQRILLDREGVLATACLDTVQPGSGKQRIPLGEGLFGRRTTFAYRILSLFTSKSHGHDLRPFEMQGHPRALQALPPQPALRDRKGSPWGPRSCPNPGCRSKRQRPHSHRLARDSKMPSQATTPLASTLLLLPPPSYPPQSTPYVS
jgi:hypothetical protein